MLRCWMLGVSIRAGESAKRTRPEPWAAAAAACLRHSAALRGCAAAAAAASSASARFDTCNGNLVDGAHTAASERTLAQGDWCPCPAGQPQHCTALRPCSKRGTFSTTVTV
jgi:hypothetical protein